MLLDILRFMSPSDFVAPFLHPGAALCRLTNVSAPSQSPRRCAQTLYARPKKKKKEEKKSMPQVLAGSLHRVPSFGGEYSVASSFPQEFRCLFWCQCGIVEPGEGGRDETRVLIRLPMQSTSPALPVPHQEKTGEICCISRGGAWCTPTTPSPTQNLLYFILTSNGIRGALNLA